MRILISGSHGLVGSALLSARRQMGDSVIRLVRRPPSGADEILWNPSDGKMDLDASERFDAVIHLAGENLAEGRWTEAKKKRLRDSRVVSTALLADRLAALTNPPRTLLCASAVGIYGDRSDEMLTEESAPGRGFLASLGEEWEAAGEPARRRGIRVVHLRFGIILSSKGGALGKMLLPFKLGLGGKIGSGRQYWSWIAIDDVLGIVAHLLNREDIEGPVNVVAPQAVSNSQFTAALAKVLHRPAVLPLPAFLARIVLGEMADAALLSSQRAKPDKLLRSGYAFRWPALEPALEGVLGAAA